MTTQRTFSQGRKVIILALSVLLVGSMSSGLIASGQPAAPTHITRKSGAQPRRAEAAYTPDTLLIMPNPRATKDELRQALEDNGCQLVNVIGSGAYTVFEIRTPRGKLVQIEQKLKKDKHFGLMQRNYQSEPLGYPADDPEITKGNDKFLTQVKAPKAWELGVFGAGQTIAIMDSGCQKTTGDLSGKTKSGYDSTTIDAKAALYLSPIAAAAGLAGPLGAAGVLGGVLTNFGSSVVNPGGDKDKDPTFRNGHGTMVATVAAGILNNNMHGAGIAPSAQIYPVRDIDGTGQGSAESMMAGIWHLITTGGPKILNISQGPTNGNLGDPSNTILHLYMQAYHDLYGGIIFVAAGNDGVQVSGSRLPYLNVVSAIDGSNELVVKGPSVGWGSSFGNVTFACPGIVDTVDKDDHDVESTGGTSFASPACAGVAALVWSANPGLSNTQVEHIMKQTAKQPANFDPVKFGYGIPDAEAAVKAAQGT